MSNIIPTNSEKVMNHDDFIVSKTDLKGNITYCNKIFMEYAGLTERELLGKPHNIVRHPDMPKLIFKLLWGRIKNKQEIFAYVKNIRADGGFYWVFANITPSLDEHGNTIGYYSVRRKPNQIALDIIKKLYQKLLDLEKSDGINSSSKYLEGLLEQKGIGYDQFMHFLQHGDV